MWQLCIEFVICVGVVSLSRYNLFLTVSPLSWLVLFLHHNMQGCVSGNCYFLLAVDCSVLTPSTTTTGAVCGTSYNDAAQNSCTNQACPDGDVSACSAIAAGTISCAAYSSMVYNCFSLPILLCATKYRAVPITRFATFFLVSSTVLRRSQASQRP